MTPIVDEQPPVELDPALFRRSATGECHLVGGKCRACGTYTWGIKAICPGCWAEGTQIEAPIGRHGTLYSAATVRQAPPGFTVPYMMGVIDLPEGLRIVGRVSAADGHWSKDAHVTLAAADLATTAEGAKLIGPVYRLGTDKG